MIVIWPRTRYGFSRRCRRRTLHEREETAQRQCEFIRAARRRDARNAMRHARLLRACRRRDA